MIWMTTVCAAALAIACTPLKQPSLSSTAPLSASDRQLKNEILAEVNRYRAQVGANPLRSHAGLDRLAQQHSEFLRLNRNRFSLYGKNVSHDGFENRLMIAQTQYNMSTISENVVAGNPKRSNAAAVLVRTWIDSPSHRYTMRQRWGATGLGVAVDEDGMIFVTEIFGNEGSSRHPADPLRDPLRRH